jgi:hypothetical protein
MEEGAVRKTLIKGAEGFRVASSFLTPPRPTHCPVFALLRPWPGFAREQEEIEEKEKTDFVE